MQNNAYLKGYAAKTSGWGIYDCPYLYYTQEREDWIRGWKDAHQSIWKRLGEFLKQIRLYLLKK